MNQKNIDQNIRHEAALLYANGDSRGAVALLTKRINVSNGYCDTRIWLMLLEVYQILGQQEAYEKIAVHFSNRFNFSPPAWDNGAVLKNEKSAGQWRNALVVEGAPSQINDDKRRDFLRASKELGSSRLDLSRMKINDDPSKTQQELARLLEIMERLRKIKVPTLFMGETEILRFLEEKTEQLKNTPPHNEEQVYWNVLFEILQWRGEENKHDKLLLDFMDTYQFCPVSFDPNECIALAPRVEEEYKIIGEEFALPEVTGQVHDLFDFIQQQWDKNMPAEILMTHVKRISADAARELALFLQNHMEQHPASDVVFLDTSEIISGLFETTGVEAHAQIRHRHGKLRDLYKS